MLGRINTRKRNKMVTKGGKMAEEFLKQYPNKEKIKIKKPKLEMNNKVVSKDIVKSKKVTIRIKEVKQEPYKPIYFKDKYEREKRLFFKS